MRTWVRTQLWWDRPWLEQRGQFLPRAFGIEMLFIAIVGSIFNSAPQASTPTWLAGTPALGGWGVPKHTVRPP